MNLGHNFVIREKKKMSSETPQVEKPCFELSSNTMIWVMLFRKTAKKQTNKNRNCVDCESIQGVSVFTLFQDDTNPGDLERKC